MGGSVGCLGSSTPAVPFACPGAPATLCSLHPAGSGPFFVLYAFGPLASSPVTSGPMFCPSSLHGSPAPSLSPSSPTLTKGASLLNELLKQKVKVVVGAQSTVLKGGGRVEEQRGGAGWGCCERHSPFEGGFCQPSSSSWHCTFLKEKTRLPWRQIWE